MSDTHPLHDYDGPRALCPDCAELTREPRASTYAVKVRPAGATAWFWLAGPGVFRVQLTTLRRRAWLMKPELADTWAKRLNGPGYEAQAVPLVSTQQHGPLPIA